MLDKLLQLFQTPDIPEQVTFKVYNHLCLNFRSGRRLCDACKDICPVQGIDLTGKQLQITECIDCGLCAVACPTGVLDQLWNGFMQVVNVSRDRRPHIWLTCHKAGAVKEAVHLNCLGELTPELILYLLHPGSDKVNILYQPEFCQGCKCQPGQRSWINTMKKLDSIYSLNTDCLHVYAELPEYDGEVKQPMDYSRRNLLRSLSSEARQVMGDLLIKQRETRSDQRFSQKLSLRRRLFRYVISNLPPEKVELMEPGYLRHPEIDAGCTFCGSCSVLCPAGAMRMEDSKTGPIMTVDPTACNMCGLCAATCPAQTIRVDWTIPNDGPAQRITLARGEWRTCDVCRCDYVAHVGQTQVLCPVCINSQHKPRLIWPEVPE